MRTCWLKFGKRASPQHWEVDATGYACISSGTECAGRRLPLITCMDKGPKRRLRIGRCLDTGGTSRASAVYLAEDLGPVGDSKPKDHSGRLFT